MHAYLKQTNKHTNVRMSNIKYLQGVSKKIERGRSKREQIKIK